MELFIICYKKEAPPPFTTSPTFFKTPRLFESIYSFDIFYRHLRDDVLNLVCKRYFCWHFRQNTLTMKTNVPLGFILFDNLIEYQIREK